MSDEATLQKPPAAVSDAPVQVATMTRDEILRAFVAAGSVAQQIALLIEGLRSGDPLVRQTCAIRLGCLGDAASDAVAALLEVAMHEQSAPVRSWGAFALARMGHEEEALAVLLELLGSPLPEVRCHAAIALSALGPAIPHRAVPALVGALDDGSENVRWAIAWALGEVGPLAHDAIAPLTRLKQDPSASVRVAVATALRKIRLRP